MKLKRKTGRKILSFWLALVMVFTLFPASAMAEENAEAEKSMSAVESAYEKSAEKGPSVNANETEEEQEVGENSSINDSDSNEDHTISATPSLSENLAVADDEEPSVKKEYADAEETSEAEKLEEAEKNAETQQPLEDDQAVNEDGLLDTEQMASTAEENVAESKTMEVSLTQYPAVHQSRTVNGIAITVDAEPGVFPEGATLSAAFAGSGDSVGETNGDGQVVAASYAFDIKVVDTNENELQPPEGKTVHVSFSTALVADQNLDTSIYHVSGGVSEELDTSESGKTVTAVSDGFSLYKVEFTYDKKQYVLPGGESVALSEILAEVGLIGTPTDVQVSSPALFSASSESGEWIIYSHQSFETEEWMRVTINGIIYEIVVTDPAEISGDVICVIDGGSGAVTSDMTATMVNVIDRGTLTINKDVTLTLNCSRYFFVFYRAKMEVHGTLTGSVPDGDWMGAYINVYLSDGAKYTVTGLTCLDGDNYLRYYGYDAATDGNGTVSVKNGSADVTNETVGYKTTTYTFTATPAAGYKLKNWTKGAGGEVLGTDTSIDVTCEQNGQYQVYANFELDTVAVTGVTLNKDSTTLNPGDTKTLTATVAPDNATDKTVTWASNNMDVATVADGVVTAVAPGTATITVTTTDGSKTAACSVTVNKSAGSISYGTSNVSKTYGDAVFTNPLTHTGDGSVSYASDDTSVATVNPATGEVTIVGVGDGSATITATVEDSANYIYATKTAGYTLNVSAADMSVSAGGYDGTYDGNQHSITVSGTPSGATVKYGTTEGTYDTDVSPAYTDAGTFTVYYQVTAENYKTATGSATVTINKADQTAPDKPTQAAVSVNSVTLNTIENGEYSMDGTNWQESPSFTGLTKNTEYTFYQRIKGDANHNASPASASATISTSNHNHSWSYTANGDTITATCGNTDGGHDGDLTSTLKINAPAHTTYGDGNIAEATITGSIDGVSTPEIEYINLNEKLTAAPTDAGENYVAQITLGGETAHVDYAIAKADPAYTTPSDLTATYGDTLTDVTLPTSWAWANSSASVGNVGTNSFKATFTPADTANYKIVENIDVTVTVGKADPAYTTPSGLTATYGDTLVDVTLPAGWSWADSSAAVGNAGTNTFKANYIPDDTANYNTVENVDLSVTVGKASVTVTADAKSKTYGESNPVLTYTATGLIGNDKLSGTLSRETGENAGTYKINQGTLTAGDNYEIGFTGADFTISKANITPKVSITGWTYGKTEGTPSVTGNEGDGSVSYSYATKGEDTFKAEVPKAAGDYTVKATVAATDNYNGGEATADFTIEKAAITITADDKSSKYGDNITDLTTKTGGDYVEGDNLGITASTTATKTSDVGEYDITVNWNENPNYTATLTNGKYTITKSDLAVTATGYSGAYDGEAHGISVDVGSSDAAVYYSETELTADNYSTAGGTTNIAYTNVGEHTVFFYVVSGNYEPDTVSGSKTVVITKATGEAGDGQKPTANTGLVYNGEEQALVTAPAELPDGYTKVQYSVDGGTTWTDTVPAGTDAGDYTVAVKYAGDTNHNDFDGDSITVTVGKATGKAEEGQKPTANTGLVYNGKDQALVTAPAALPDGYTKVQYSIDGGETWTDTVPTGKEAGDYTVSSKYAGDANHADFEGDPIKVTIKAVYTVKFNMNGADAMDDQSVIEGEKATRPADPERKGYQFDGWYQDATFAAEFDFDTPITADVTAYAKWISTVYTITSITGVTDDASHTWTKGSTSDVVITVKLTEGVDDSFSHFVDVLIDGKNLVNGTDYTVREGSTIVTLKAASLQKLSTGAHTVTVKFDNGQAETRLTVKEAATATVTPTVSPTPAVRNTSVPRTGDESNPGMWMGMLLFSGIVILATKKRRTSQR